MEKKTYVKPELTVHGDIEKITLASTAANSDSPSGTNDAFCNGQLPCS